jgi:hypothetical protein
MKTIALIASLFLVQLASACSFQLFPTFGADWYHQNLFHNFYQDNPSSAFGLTFNQRSFDRTYVVFYNDGTNHRQQTLNETITDQSFFYLFHLNPKFQCMVMVTQTNINADAIGEQDPLSIISASQNQLGLSCDYEFLSFTKGLWSAHLHVTGAVNSTISAHNKFYTDVEWVKLYANQLSPRLIAGSYASNYTLGLAGVFEKKNFVIEPSLSARMYTANVSGFVFGTDANAEIRLSYPFKVLTSGIRIAPQAGFNFEYGSTDWQHAGSNMDPSAMAKGHDLFFSSGAQIRVKGVNLSCSYFVPLLEKGFTDYQLYNKSQFVFMAAYSF